jgi:hypothetical protein
MKEKMTTGQSSSRRSPLVPAWPVLLLALAFLASFRLAAAHTDGKMQLASADAGPYRLTVWTSPDPAKVGELHVATAVVLAYDASPVLDASVLVEMTPIEGGGPALSGPASTEDSENKFLYEAVLRPERDGRYEVRVTVTGSDGSGGEAAFQLEVEPAGGASWTLLIALGVVAIAGGAYIYMKRSRSPKAE